ncbi:tyrosine-type recombinase/integrase [Pseudomonas putida]|uniref:Integrase n=1 Tax=Pseudomonas putida TaxID=303 RepID=A0A2S3WHW5_PSEPU|nr:site-specific integrase [Pseudomonas putida]POF90555.1 integrase [Pseudomonas putida]
MDKSTLPDHVQPTRGIQDSADWSDQKLPRKGNLKNVRLVHTDPPRLYETATGQPVPSFNAYSRGIHRQLGTKRSRAGIDQYTYRNAGLIDYLYESRALGAGQIDPEALNETINSYFIFLTQGVNSTDFVIRTVAKRLGRKPISIVSGLAYKAAANDFLRLHAALLRDSLAMANFLNPGTVIEAPSELDALADRRRSKTEIDQMRSKLMEFKEKPAEVYQTAQGGLEGVKAPKSKPPKEFPSRRILTLIENLPALEKVVVLLQAGGGLRQSEAWAMRNDEINVKERSLRIEDPNHWRDPSAKDLPFKGRTTAKIYMFEPFETLFYDALAEYKLIRPTSDSEFLFVSDCRNSYGEALVDVIKPNSLNRRLNRALAKAQQKVGVTENTNTKSYTSHSLRHFYGYWARNFVYIPGRRTVGLTLGEIQVLMGHANIASTIIYAKLDQEVLMAEIHASQQMAAIWNKTSSIDSLRADAYEDLAQDLRGRLAA